VLFTGLSNSNHFGGEQDSPEPLRYLALAFLNRANQLDPGGAPWEGQIQAEDKQIQAEDKQIQAEDRLIESYCTEVLFNKMRPLLREAGEKNAALGAIYRAMIPAAW
jgi:hypothetical protein